MLRLCCRRYIGIQMDRFLVGLSPVRTLVIVVAALLSGCRHTVLPDASFPQDDVVDLPLLLPSDSTHEWYRDVHPGTFAFYRSRGFQPIWVDYTAVADSLTRFIGEVRYRGLLPASYHYGELVKPVVPPWNRQTLLRRDVILTDAFIALRLDLNAGRTRPHSGKDRARVAASLARLIDGGGLIRDLRSAEPRSSEYEGLKEGLAHLLAIADSSDRRKILSGAISGSSPLFENVRVIEANLERWRWEKDWGDRYVYVNVPSLSVEVIESGRAVLTSRAIVGKPNNQTPSFSSVIQCFITYPYWHVPRRIAVEEFLPFIQRDTSFIKRNNFDVLDRKGRLLNSDSLPWQRYSRDYFPVMLRQREGNENSLGVVKFQFDNPYAVFIHDTNAPRLFRYEKRALSHGCIRMEKATQLAHYLVTGAVNVKSPLIERYLREKQRHTVDLANPIPVHIRYFTAAFRNGGLVFYDDIYDKDRALILKLTPTSGASADAINIRYSGTVE